MFYLWQLLVDMRFFLFTGFLGSGKTTLIIKTARYAAEQGKNVAVLVNEIGELGIDDQLMRKLGMNVRELLNGCICCTLSADLVSTLEQLSKEYRPDIVMIEPSGAADPKSTRTALTYYRGEPIERETTLAVLDPLRLEMLIEVMSPLIVSQIQHADSILITKCDMAGEENIRFALQTAARCNPGANILQTGSDTLPDTLAMGIGL